MLGQERLTACLSGIQYLARSEDAAGARLLAAFLDANTPSSLLLPKVSRFSSTRRVMARLAAGAKPDAFLKNWQQRLAETVASGEKFVPPIPRTKTRPVPPDAEGPYPLLRSLLRHLVPNTDLDEPDPQRAALLASVLRIEVDAYQERISQLAGMIDPFRVAAIARVLPLLARADNALRDLRRLIGWIEEGNFSAAFARSVPRYHDALDEAERQRFTEALNSSPDLCDLAELHANLEAKPMPVPELAGRMARLMALGHQLVAAGKRETELDLVTAALLAQQYDADGEFVMPLTPDLAEIVAAVLLAPSNGRGLGSWSLEGLEVTAEGLVLRRPQLGLGDRIWRHGGRRSRRRSGAQYYHRRVQENGSEQYRFDHRRTRFLTQPQGGGNSRVGCCRRGTDAFLARARNHRQRPDAVYRLRQQGCAAGLLAEPDEHPRETTAQVHPCKIRGPVRAETHRQGQGPLPPRSRRRSEEIPRQPDLTASRSVASQNGLDPRFGRN
jgi:hypothetical protein